MSFDVDNEILDDFFAETRQILDSTIEMFDSLTKEPSNKTLIEHIHNPIKSIQGSCVFFGIQNICELSEKMEMLLNRLLNKKIYNDKNSMDTLFEGLNILKKMLVSVENGGQTKELTEEESRIINKLINATDRLRKQKFQDISLN